jgi:hypothetical protein
MLKRFPILMKLPMLMKFPMSVKRPKPVKLRMQRKLPPKNLPCPTQSVPEEDSENVLCKKRTA